MALQHYSRRRAPPDASPPPSNAPHATRAPRHNHSHNTSSTRQAVHTLEGEVASASATDGDLSLTGSNSRRLRPLQSSLAGALNSLGLLRKQQRRFADARAAYERASDLHDETMGEGHPDAIVCRHNLAELLIAEGDAEAAADIQQEILERIARAESDGAAAGGRRT